MVPVKTNDAFDPGTPFGRMWGGRLVQVLLVALMIMGLSATPGQANERILSDPRQQLALLGYDAVAFFADDEAIIGSPDFEVLYDGLVWRFAHQGNHDAFVDDPAFYLPAYGGYCALRAAEGLAVQAQPDVFLTLGARVFFFSSVAARYAFLLEADHFITQADTVWPDVARTLAP